MDKTEDLLKKEFHYFIDHQDELVKLYNGRYIVIVGEEVIGDYETHGEAVFETKKTHEMGTFLVQRCVPGEEAYTINCRTHMALPVVSYACL